MTGLDKNGRERIERLRTGAVDPVVCYDTMYYAFWKEWERLEREHPGLADEEKYAASYRAAFCQVPVEIGAEERIVGRFSRPLGGEEAGDWARIRETVAHPRLAIVGQDSHMAPDFALLLSKGSDGIASDIRARLESERNEEKRSFYTLCLSVLDTMAAFSDRYGDTAAAMASECSDPERKRELAEIARICHKVPRHPAQSFHEAIQAAHFLCLCLSADPFRCFSMQQFQLGRIDRWLYPYYKADKDAGLLTDAEAQLLIDCLAIQINNRVPHGLSCGYMVGGRLADGTPVANELTVMGMQAVDDIRLVYPSVGYCCTADHPKELLRMACEILSHGRSHPAIFNDDIIADGLRYWGVPATECRDYIHSTCVEITPIAASNVWVASPYTNLPGLLLGLLDREWESFDALLEAYLAALDESIERNARQFTEGRKLRRDKGMTPLLSCFVNNCLARGRDIEKGGAKYNWITPSFVGAANLVDSLFAIKVLIFDEKKLTFGQLKAALEGDFAGCEALRAEIVSRIPKYGNDIEEVDALFGRITDFIIASCERVNASGIMELGFSEAKLIPSVFCWVVHERFGRQTGATPDGRRAGFPLGDGSGPCQGREMCGPTASILSSTKWEHKKLIGGVAVNMKFSKSAFTAESCTKTAALIETFLARGGFEIQINVTDRDILLAAQKNPDAYRDLVVRIGGYSDYFVCLSPEMQAEVLERTEHTI